MADGPLSRRDFVKHAVVAASAAALGVGAFSSVLPALSGADGGRRSPILRGTGRDATAEPLTLRDLDGPAIALAVGTWEHLPVLVLKVPKATLEAAAARRGYNTGQHALQHPSEPEHAVLAYDARCTHLGCTVGFNKGLGGSKDVPDYDGDGLPDGRILCPCHQAQFDAFDLARNVPGTPGPRPLGIVSIAFGAEPGGDGARILEAYARLRQEGYRAGDADGDGAAFRLAG